MCSASARCMLLPCASAALGLALVAHLACAHTLPAWNRQPQPEPLLRPPTFGDDDAPAADPRVTLCTLNWSPSQFTCVVREIFEMRVQVMNELPYLVEWITYYHIQGVQRVALCDHDSTDNSYLLPELFAQNGVGGVVFDRAPKPRQTEFNNSIDEQLACMDQCFERYREDTDWFIIADVDEFMWAPEHPRLVDFLAALPDTVSEVSATELRFGSRGQVLRSANDIRRDEVTGRLTYSNSTGGVTLITQDFMHRGFSRNLGEPEMESKLFPNCSYRAPCNGWVVCDNCFGKSIGRTRDVVQLYNHRNRLVNGSRSITPKDGALRMHHHAVRSWEDALIKDRIWDKCDPTVIWKLADRYLSSFNDISMLMYRQEFRRRLMPFLS